MKELKGKENFCNRNEWSDLNKLQPHALIWLSNSVTLGFRNVSDIQITSNFFK